MKITASTNIQNHNSSVKNHTDRHFEVEKNGTDTNIQHINTALSHYNLSSHGKIIERKGHKRFDRTNTPTGLSDKDLKADIKKSLNTKYADYIKHYNNSKSVKSHPKRRITSLYSKLKNKKPTKTQLKHDAYATNRLLASERTATTSIGNADTNAQIIKLIMHQKHWGHKEARNAYIKTASEAFIHNIRHFNQRNTDNLQLVGFTTNVDETIDKHKTNPDSLHIHYTLLPTTWSKLDNNFQPKAKARPSFSFAKAMCANEHVLYQRKTMKVAYYKGGKKRYKNVNKSLHLALQTFKKQEGQAQLHYMNQQMQRNLGFNLNFTFTQTGQKITGQDMEVVRHKMATKHRQQAKRKNAKQRHMQHSLQNKRNGIKRARTQKKINRRLKYLKKRNQQIHKASTSLTSRQKQFNSSANSTRTDITNSAKSVAFDSMLVANESGLNEQSSKSLTNASISLNAKASNVNSDINQRTNTASVSVSNAVSESYSSVADVIAPIITSNQRATSSNSAITQSNSNVSQSLDLANQSLAQERQAQSLATSAYLSTKNKRVSSAANYLNHSASYYFVDNHGNKDRDFNQQDYENVLNGKSNLTVNGKSYTGFNAYYKWQDYHVSETREEYHRLHGKVGKLRKTWNHLKADCKDLDKHYKGIIKYISQQSYQNVSNYLSNVWHGYVSRIDKYFSSKQSLAQMRAKHKKLTHETRHSHFRIKPDKKTHTYHVKKVQPIQRNIPSLTERQRRIRALKREQGFSR